jgi:hypothetical protein
MQRARAQPSQAHRPPASRALPRQY